MPPINIHLAQIPSRIGDFQRNSDAILAQLHQAKVHQADLAVFPELALCGYPAEDWLLVPSFRRQGMEALQTLVSQTHDLPPFILGVPWEEDGKLYNAAVLVRQGQIEAVTTKQALPSFGVFDETRYFANDRPPLPFVVGNVRIACALCQDFWEPDIMARYDALNPDLFVVLNASPYETGKFNQRLDLAKVCKKPVVYVNRVGGQDELVFDGRSFVYDAGHLQTLGHCVDDGQTIRLPLAPHPSPPPQWGEGESEEKEIYTVLTRGLSDYVHHMGARKVLLGLSGGIDSALTAAIAVDALGAHRVYGLRLPSPYTSEDSMHDAAVVADALGIEMLTLPITPAMQTMGEILNHPTGVTHENIQARLRGMILMAHANKNHDLLLTTGNKSELAMGYATLYGDMCGGFSVLKDLYKTEVYRLARWRHAQSPVFNTSILTKEPTAELRPDQKDSDSLPPYDHLDALLKHFIEGYGSLEEAISKGFDPAEAKRVYRALHAAEYKRRQGPVGVKITPRAFGLDWRFPMMQGVV